jgi:hypothetical protein
MNKLSINVVVVRSELIPKRIFKFTFVPSESQSLKAIESVYDEL